MKFFAIVISLLSAVAVLGQTSDTLVTEKTSSHIHVPGTDMYVIVPADYKPATEFRGFSSKSRGAQVRVEENHLIGLDERVADFEQSMKQSGMRIVEFRDLTFNGYKAKYISTEAGGLIGSCILLFGDEHFYIQVGGTYRLSDRAAGNNIRTAALMSYLEKPGISAL
jgi:hypothetical protein